jgi:hypothetical protein
VNDTDECNAYEGVVRRRNTIFPNEDVRGTIVVMRDLLDKLTELFAQSTQNA